MGETVFIFGRRFFLFDCDQFSRRYYKNALHIEQPPRIVLPELCEPMEQRKKPVADKSIKLIRQLYNFPKKLRYKLAMEAVHPEYKDREFILEYNLADGCMKINEIDKRNSGRRAGCFLGSIRVPKPNSNSGECYTPVDFVIGARLNIFEHWFVVIGTELFVYNYINENRDKFPEEVRENIRQWMIKEGLLEECKDIQREVKENVDDALAKMNVNDEDKNKGCLDNAIGKNENKDCLDNASGKNENKDCSHDEREEIKLEDCC